MNRRTFLKGFSAATAGALILPDRKIWALDTTMIVPPTEIQIVSESAMGNWVEPTDDASFYRGCQHAMTGDIIRVGDEVMVVTRVYYSDVFNFETRQYPVTYTAMRGFCGTPINPAYGHGGSVFVYSELGETPVLNYGELGRRS